MRHRSGSILPGWFAHSLINVASVVPRMPGGSTFAYMFTPLVAVLLMLLVVTRDGYTNAGGAALYFVRP